MRRVSPYLATLSCVGGMYRTSHRNTTTTTTTSPTPTPSPNMGDITTTATTSTTTSTISSHNKYPFVRIRDLQLQQPKGPETGGTTTTTISIRARLHKARVKGKIGFLVLRQGPVNETIQVVVEDDEELLQIASQLTPESVIDVEGKLVSAHTPVKSVSCGHLELVATRISVVTVAKSPLPFPLGDVRTKLDTRLDNRVIDMRTETTSSILRIQAKVGQFFREFMGRNDFTEIHSPKMIGTPSEGGSAVFRLDYFKRTQPTDADGTSTASTTTTTTTNADVVEDAAGSAYLAQSPQLYKQMALMGDMERVFEIGPVFRAENSLTHRHLTEFTGLDAEMVIHGSHLEVLDKLEGTMHHILHSLQEVDPTCMKLTARLVELGAAKKNNIQITLTAETISKLGLVAESYKNDNTIGKSTSSSPSPTNNNNTDANDVDKYGGRYASSTTTTTSESASDYRQPAILRLPFQGAMQLLVDKKVITAPLDDFNTAQEKQLGAIIKARYGVDIYVIDCFPASARPFYTMIEQPHLSGQCKEEELTTRSYDMYLRGEEICSGAQRIHDPAFLKSRATTKGINTVLLKDYISAFDYGAYPHGGFGLGLERIVMFYLGLADVRMASMFPRDPKRITP